MFNDWEETETGEEGEEEEEGEGSDWLQRELVLR